MKGGPGSLPGPGDSAGRGGFAHGRREDSFTYGHFRDSRSILPRGERAAGRRRGRAAWRPLGTRSTQARSSCSATRRVRTPGHRPEVGAAPEPQTEQEKCPLVMVPFVDDL